MDRTYEGVFMLYDKPVRNLQQGARLRLIFRCIEDSEVYKQLVMFRESNVNVIFTQAIAPENKKDVIVIEDVFEFFDLKWPRKKGYIYMYLEQMYEKTKDIAIVPLRYIDCTVQIKSIEQELDFEEKFIPPSDF